MQKQMTDEVREFYTREAEALARLAARRGWNRNWWRTYQVYTRWLAGGFYWARY